MELRFQAGGPESWSADAVIVFLSEDEKLEKAYPELLEAASSTALPRTLCPAPSWSASASSTR